MRRVNVNALDRISRIAAREVAFGTAVMRNAAGTITYAVDGANTTDLDGIVEDDVIAKTKDGFYATDDVVPIISAGRVNVIVEGGGTDIASGNFLKVGNDLGMLVREGTTRAVSTSVAKALEDEEVSDYTTGTMSGTAGSKSVTVASTSKFAAGDMVMLDGGGATTDSELAVIEKIISTTEVRLKEPMALTYSDDDMHKCVQIEVLLLI